MQIKKIFKAEVAHRLASSYSKRCQSFHGHSYTFEVVLSSPRMNTDEMLMDFGKVKAKINNFMDSFDHSMVLYNEDPFTPAMIDIMDKGKMRYMIVPYNPTAERMAEHIVRVALEVGLPISSCKVNETLTGQAEFFAEDGSNMDLSKVEISKAIMAEWDHHA